jgi:chromosome segregation ATPase
VRQVQHRGRDPLGAGRAARRAARAAPRWRRSSSRAPRAGARCTFAEVSLLFDNESGRVPVPQSEIEVARKVFREGGSEYALNRTACRLRDVHGPLRDTGLGSNAYAIIEAG